MTGASGSKENTICDYQVPHRQHQSIIIDEKESQQKNSQCLILLKGSFLKTLHKCNASKFNYILSLKNNLFLKTKIIFF